MRYAVDIEREEDGRWLAEMNELPGVIAYGATRDQAAAAAEALALRVLADRLENGELTTLPLDLSFNAYRIGTISLPHILTRYLKTLISWHALPDVIRKRHKERNE